MNRILIALMYSMWCLLVVFHSLSSGFSANHILVIITPGAVLLIPLLISFLLKQDAIRNEDVIKATINDIDTIVEGKRYKGALSSVVSTAIHSGDVLEVSQLCKTEQGQWFTLKFVSIPGSGIAENIRVEPISEEAAKQMLSKKPDIYEQIFGPAQVA